MQDVIQIIPASAEQGVV